jgi:Tol biopolymer transport system component
MRSIGAALSAFFLSCSAIITLAQPAAQSIESRLEIFSLSTGEPRIIYRAPVRFEAPNWTRDGKRLVFNQEGKLFTIAADGTGRPELLNLGDLRACNNDHGLSPDGTMIAVSCSGARDESAVYVLPFAIGGARPRLLTPSTPSYWHGWSPDGTTLAYVGQRNGEFDIYTVPVNGGDEQRLTTAKGLDDGPDYSPDGRWIYFNSERTGVMRIWRMRTDGSRQEQVTRDEEYADWFPHPSPDGRWIVFLSYKKDVEGHPPDHDVVLRMVASAGGTPKVLVSLFGGQGTINVPSWAPDSKQFAFVSYAKRR